MKVGQVCARTTSMIKACTWRFLASLITVVLVLIMTGEMHLAAKVGALDVIVKLVVYYLHERTWLWVGRKRGDA